MPSKRRLENRSKAFNQRVTEFSFDKWGKGLITQYSENPSGSLQELVNSRDKGTEIVGRKGSRLVNKATIKVTINPAQTLAQHVTAFSLTDGDIFTTYNITDTSDFALSQAKEREDHIKSEYDVSYLPDGYYHWFYDLRPYDMFQYNDSGETPIVYWLGNIEIPSYLEFQSHARLTRSGGVVTGKVIAAFTATVTNSVFTITSDIGGFFGEYYQVPHNILGKHVVVYTDYGSYPVRDIIEGRTNNSIFTVASTKIPDGTYNIYISDSIFSSIVNREKEKIFMHSGEDIYYSNIPCYGWKKLYRISDIKPYPGESRMDSVEDGIILFSKSGLFRINLDDNNFWQINTANSLVKTENEVRKIFGFAETEIESDDDNPVVMAGLSGTLADGITPDGTGGVIL